MACLPDIPGQGRQREWLVFGLGVEILVTGYQKTRLQGSREWALEITQAVINNAQAKDSTVVGLL